MLMRPPPTIPCWPLYPEPERSRLEAAYRREHEEYCAELNWQFKLDLSAVAIGFLLAVAAGWYLT